MSDYPMLISNKLHSFRNFLLQTYHNEEDKNTNKNFSRKYFISNNSLAEVD